jgi:hypothetical protein
MVGQPDLEQTGITHSNRLMSDDRSMASSTARPPRPPRPASQMVCPRCGRDSFHAISALYTNAVTPNGVPAPPFRDGAGIFVVNGDAITLGVAAPGGAPIWFASVCVSCKQGCVWRGDELIYPKVSQIAAPHSEMPASARELYEEAALVLPVSRRAAAALARAALERLLRALPEAESKARLDDLIAALAPRVSNRLWQTLTALRVLGNDTLHANADSDLVALYLEGDGAVVAEPIFGAINAIVEEVIVQPRVAEDLYAMIPESIRVAAELKRKQ